MARSLVNTGTHGVGSRSYDRDKWSMFAAHLGWLNVQIFGARGDGITDDAPAFQAALDAVPASGGTVYIPPAASGTYRIGRCLRHKSNTTVVGSRKAATLKTPASFVQASDWGGTATFLNVNAQSSETAFTGYRDSNVAFIDVAFDNTARGGDAHAIFNRAVQGVVIDRCLFQGGGDATAAITCDDHHVFGCRADGQFNCCYDHWGGSSNCRVVSCYGRMNPAATAQVVNFNAIRDSSTIPALAEQWNSDGFVLDDCDLYTTASQRSLNLEQLGTNAASTVKNVRITANRIYNGRIVIGGGTSAVTIMGNQFLGSSGASPTIYCRTQNAILPDFVTVIGNQFDACAAPNGMGLIDTTGTNTMVIGNQARGGSYQYGVRFAAGGGFAMMNRFPAASIAETSGASAHVGTTGANLMLGASGGGLGFYGSAGATKPTITGSRGGNAALASFLTQMASLGLLTDGTTA